MPKRKRDYSEDPSDDNVTAGKASTTSQRKRIEEKLFHGKKVLHRALKVAKGFERQKLGRRRKSALKEQGEQGVARIDAEIEALKTLDLTGAAESHLHKTLLKNKAISQSSALPAQVTASLKSTQSAAVANVTARLYNSNPVKEAMGETLTTIRLAMGLGARPPGPGSQNTSKSAKASKDPATLRNGSIRNGNGQLPLDEEEDSMNASESEDSKGLGHRRHPVESVGADEDEDDFAEFDERIAHSSEESSPSRTASVSGSDMEHGPTLGTGRRLSMGTENSVSPSPSVSDSSPDPSKARRGNSAAQSTDRPGNASFLPSLTMGGYWSGSEAEDISDPDVAPRKNRRGQRERQKIWEKKYGKGAKHLTGQAKGTSKPGEDQRDKGWDPKRGAQPEDAGAAGRYRPPWMKSQAGGSQGSKNFASGGNATQLKPRPSKQGGRDDVGKQLHPSWEAAKKAKEKKMESGSFAGKKVVFD